MVAALGRLKVVKEVADAIIGVWFMAWVAPNVSPRVRVIGCCPFIESIEMDGDSVSFR